MKEEFPSSEEEEEPQEDIMSMTLQQERQRHLTREIKKLRARQDELRVKIQKKNEEGV